MVLKSHEAKQKELIVNLENQNYQESVKWYQKAAKQGHAKAQFNLGVMYANGKGVKQDYAKAKEYFGLACDNKYQDGCDMYKMLNQ